MANPKKIDYALFEEAIYGYLNGEFNLDQAAEHCEVSTPTFRNRAVVAFRGDTMPRKWFKNLPDELPETNDKV